MALVLKDRVKETTTTTGTGTYTLAGAVAGFEAFSEIGNSNTTYYCCTDGTDFEVGIGTYTASGTTLARTTILQSSNSDAAVNWTSGNRTIFCTQPAEKAVFLDGSGDVEFASGQTAKFNSNNTDPVIDIAGTGPNRLRFRQTNNFTDTANGVDLSYRTTPDDLRIERTSNQNIIAEFGGDDGHAALYFDNSKKLETLTGGVDVTGNITVSGTVDGRDLATDGSKLDGIEASADVTDTANVTAAGALMDSEVANLAQVKAFDSSDYATAAQGSTADAALPKAGGTMTGNLELNNANIVFEGSTADANETTLTAIDPTADRTISLPNQSGTAMVTIGDSFRTGISQTYSGAGSPSYLVDGEFQEIATVTPSGNSHNYFFTGRIVAQSGQNVHTLNITVALRSNTLPDLSFTANYNEDVVGTASQYITPVLYTKETSPASFILAVEVHNTIFGTLTADLDFFARTQADLADVSVNTTDGSEITSTPSGYTLNQFTKTTALDNGNQFVFNQDVQFTGAAYNAVWDKSQNRLEFADNAAISFGTGNDISLDWDGTDGHLVVQGTLNIEGSGETLAKFIDDGAVELYHNNSKKLETASGGISVTGEVAATSLDISGDVDVDGTLEADNITLNGTALAASATTDTTNASNIGSGTLPNARLDQQLQDVAGLAVTNGNFIVGDGSNFVAESGATARASLGLGTAATSATGDFATAAQGTTADAAMPKAGGTFTGDVTFTGANYNIVFDKSDDALEFADNAKAVFGAGGDLQIYHSGSGSFISDAGTGNLRIGGSAVTIENSSFNETMMLATQNGAVELYYDNSKMFETTSAGIKVHSTVDNGPNIDLISDDPSDATDYGYEGQIRFFAENDASESSLFAAIRQRTADVSDGTENGAIYFGLTTNGTFFDQYAMLDGGFFLLNDNPYIQFTNTRSTNFDVTIVPPNPPSADRTITLPDATGTVQLTDGSGASLTSLNASQLSSGTVPNARLDAQLQDVAGLAVTNGGFIVGDGSNFVLETGSTARTSLGLGSIATQASNNVSITGGSVSGITDLAIADGGTGASSASAARTNLGLGTAAVAATGISNGNVPVFTSGVADNDFLRVNGTSIEGRSASELASDIGASTTDEATALAIALG